MAAPKKARGRKPASKKAETTPKKEEKKAETPAPETTPKTSGQKVIVYDERTRKPFIEPRLIERFENSTPVTYTRGGQYKTGFNSFMIHEIEQDGIVIKLYVK